MLKALIIDFDGTMMDSESLWCDAFREWVYDHYGFDMPEELFIRNSGSDGSLICEEVKRQTGQDMVLKEMMDWSYDQVHVRANSLELLPGVMDLLKIAKAKGLKISTGTSSRAYRVIAQLERLDAMQYFDALSTVDLVEHAKPAPDIYLKAAELLGEAPEACIVVEDSPAGIRAGAAAGMKTILVPDQAAITQEILDLSDAMMNSLLEVPAYIEMQMK